MLIIREDVITWGLILQYEGATREGGRGPSVWNTFSHKYPRLFLISFIIKQLYIIT